MIEGRLNKGASGNKIQSDIGWRGNITILEKVSNFILTLRTSSVTIYLLYHRGIPSVHQLSS